MPEVKLPVVTCDKELHLKLRNVPMLSLCNKSFNMVVLGNPGSGKSSLINGWLNTREYWYKCFHQVLVFMPEKSRKSIRGGPLDTIPDEQIFSDLNPTTLAIAENMLKKEWWTLIIFDDVQEHFKGDCEKQLARMAANRRHNNLCMVFIAQSYKKISAIVRRLFSDLVIFRVSKQDMRILYDDMFDLSKEQWTDLMRLYNKECKNPENTNRNFLYYNIESQRIFLGNTDQCEEIEFHDEQDEVSESSKDVKSQKDEQSEFTCKRQKT